MMKQLLTVLFCLPAFLLLASGDTVLADMSTGAAGGIGLGSILAIVLSWSRNNSVLWAIIHAIFGWLYVIYFVLTR